jgi:membrane protease YdiL (CAAX protease family)
VIRRHPIITFFLLAYGISWVVWAPLWLPAFGLRGLPVLPFHHALGAIGPVTAGLVMAAVEGGRAGATDLLRRMVLWRGRLRWVGVALAGPFLLVSVGALVAWAVGGETLSLAGLGVSREFPQFSFLAFLAYNMVSFGYGEETGWRGYALPRLQARHTAFGATLLLAVGWAMWHGPLFLYRPGYTSMGIGGIAGWFVSLLTGAILLTWLFNASRGSLLVVALFHATVDIAFTSDVASPISVNTTGALITVWGVVVLVVTGPRFMSFAGKMISTGGPSQRVRRETGLDQRDRPEGPRPG